MALEAALSQYTKTNVTNVSNRVYAVRAPQTVTEPYLTFLVVSNNFVHSVTDSGLAETRVQFDVYGDTYASVKGVVAQLKSTYRNYVQGSGSVITYTGGTHWIQAALLDNETDMYEEDTGRYRTSLDIIFWHVET